MVGRRPLEANIPGSNPGSATNGENRTSETLRPTQNIPN